MPVFDQRRDPDDVARANRLHRTAFLLHQTLAGNDKQRLAERMRVTCGAGAGSERDRRSTDPRRLVAL